MKEITINEKDLLEAYRAGNADQKTMLEELYGKELFEYDWKKITSYEKACEVLGIKQISISETGDRPQYMRMANAMQQLLVICEAINGYGNCYDKDWWGYYPVFVMYSKQEMDDIGEAECKRQGIHQITAASNSTYSECAGFRCSYTDNRGAIAHADCGFPICLNSKEKALFVGKQFFELCSQCYGLTLQSDK